jgi:hypothetical protein
MYLWGRHNGKKIGGKELIKQLCSPYQELERELETSDGCVYSVKTKFLTQKIHREEE